MFEIVRKKYLRMGYNGFNEGLSLDEIVAASDSEPMSANYYRMRMGYRVGQVHKDMRESDANYRLV